MDIRISFRYITRGQTKYDSIAMTLSEIQKKVSKVITNEIISHLIACEYSKNSQIVALAFISEEGQLEDILRTSVATAFSTTEKAFVDYVSVQPAVKNYSQKNTAQRLFEGCEPINGHQIVYD